MHFNRLKLCKPGTQFQHNVDGELWPNAVSSIDQQREVPSYLVGENLELVDIDDVPMAQLGRVRQRLLALLISLSLRAAISNFSAFSFSAELKVKNFILHGISNPPCSKSAE